MTGAKAAAIARVLGIPAPRIRKWAQLGQVHRHPDGSFDPLCVAAWESRTVLGADYQEWHDERCGVSHLQMTAV